MDKRIVEAVRNAQESQPYGFSSLQKETNVPKSTLSDHIKFLVEVVEDSEKRLQWAKKVDTYNGTPIYRDARQSSRRGGVLLTRNYFCSRTWMVVCGDDGERKGREDMKGEMANLNREIIVNLRTQIRELKQLLPLKDRIMWEDVKRSYLIKMATLALENERLSEDLDQWRTYALKQGQTP